MTKAYNSKKCPGLIVVLLAIMNLWQHHNYKKNIAKTFSESLVEANYNPPKIIHVSLPLSFTFLAQNVPIEVIYEDDELERSVVVIATPIRKFPFVWFLIDSAYHLDITHKEMDKLSLFKNEDS